MEFGKILVSLIVALGQILPDIIDTGIQITNSVKTINRMDIDIFVDPPFGKP